MWQDFKNIYHLLIAFLANIYYDFPSRKLTVIGVTGTSGKTTTTHLIYEMLKNAGFKVSLLSTIKAVIGNKEYDTGFHVTTPDPHILSKLLNQAVKHGDEYFVLEVSSHGLHQNRAAFIHFNTGVLTTLAHEHLDYHKTFANYAKAKFKLLHQSDYAVLPFEGIADEIKPAVNFDAIKKKMVTFGIKKGDQTQKKWNLRLKMAGDFNLLDALAAAAVGEILKIPEVEIKKGLENFKSLSGRFEEIPTNKDFRVIIDFAHKPDALEAAIKAARSEIKKNGRIIAMFGCASQRDVLKRPMMGEISGRLADITVLTDEDPRFEEPVKIIDEIAKGCTRAGAGEIQNSEFRIQNFNKEHFYFKIPNRGEAIEFIIKELARKNDIILLCGKGHEKSINYKGVETPWSEHEAVKKALKTS